MLSYAVPPPDSAPTLRVVDVAIDSRAGGGEAIWTYRPLTDIEVGDAVLVPLGVRWVIGFAIGFRTVTEEELGFSFRALRPVRQVVEGVGLPPPVVEAVRFVSEEYLCSLSVALSVASPPGARERIITTWRRTQLDLTEKISPLQSEVLKVVEETEDGLAESKTKKLSEGSLKALRLLEKEGLVERSIGISTLNDRPREAMLLRLTADEAKIERFLMKEGKRKPAQTLTLVKLQTAEQAVLPREEIKALCGVTDQTLKSLMSAGLLEVVQSEMVMARTPPVPNPRQQEAIDAIGQAVANKESTNFLVFGVTGSGKTEVFLRAAAEALKNGRQVLYLVPEIALATQAIAQLRERFGDRVAVLHSDLGTRERMDNWLRIRRGEASVVLGARSAVFAPLANIGLIIMDEEHEGSYKQETSPRYRSKAVARRLSELHHAPLVLGSATPSVESYWESKSGRCVLLELPQRAASAQLPTVEIDDLREGYRKNHPVILGESLQRHLTQTLERKQQAILFLNRRAYSPFLLCRDCGKQFMCPRCSVSLSYSRKDRMLRCHHCDYEMVPPEACPKCGGIRMQPMGVGTEKVEEQVSLLFPEARIARLDRDITRKKGALEDILARFRVGDLDILVGTQMVAKGLDFPNVTLVGVITADITLNLPDYRASERTYQLLSQVAGRAGRGQSAGHVVVQTFNPDHVALLAAQNHDYLAFYRDIRMERELAGYPPFKRLVNVLITGEDITHVRGASTRVAERLRQIPDAEVLGPVSAPIEKLQDRWRRHVLVKLPPDASSAPIGRALADLTAKTVQVLIDVDPNSLL